MLLKIEFGHRTYLNCGDPSKPSPSGPALHACEPVPDLKAALSLPSGPNDGAGLDVGVLLAMLFALRLAIYIALRRKTKAA